MNGILSKNGSIIASVRNNRYFLNTWETLGGIFSQIPNEHDYYEFNIDSLFTFLSNSHLTISKLIRIEIKNQTNLELNSQSSFPPTILETLKKDPESDVFSYVVEIKKKRLDDEKTREWVTEFPKNYFLESLKSEIEKNENSVELFKKRSITHTQLESQDDTIKRLEKEVEELDKDRITHAQLELQDDIIKHLEKEVEDEKIMTQNILEGKREIKNIFENFNDSNIISKLPSDNMDKTLLGLQAMLVEYTELRNALKSSKTYNLMKKLDKIRGK
jgi:ribosomal protein S25